MPVMTSATGTWPKKMEKIGKAERKWNARYLSVIRDKVKLETIRGNKTMFWRYWQKDSVIMNKWEWPGHIGRQIWRKMDINKDPGGMEIVRWKKEPRRRSCRKWTDDIIIAAGKQWLRKIQARGRWKILMAAYVDTMM